MKKVEEVFVTEGVPLYTFVKPPNYNNILVDIRKAGKPVIIEGQSGTGKTTTAKKIIDEVAPTAEIEYLTAREKAHADIIEQYIDSSFPNNTLIFIDDFHRLPIDLQRKLGDIAKMAAEGGESQKHPKLVIIGINQVGANLIQLVPDIAKRCGIHRIQSGNQEAIDYLVQNGCKELNINIYGHNQIFSEAKGDYWLAQHLSQEICLTNNILQEQTSLVNVPYDIPGIRKAVVERLESSFYGPIKDFCRGKRPRRSNDPYFKLLKAVGEQDSSIVDLNEIASNDEGIRGSINNIKERRLTVLLNSKPSLQKHFFYSQESKWFAIEDPALFYFIKHLDWERLRTDCGFKRAANTDREFDIAISFAGENREFARVLSEKLAILDASVFYDEWYENNYLGRTWSKEFKRIFSSDSWLVVCILDKNYSQKIWPTFEKECFLPRIAEGGVIPIELDNTIFVGIPKDLVKIVHRWDTMNPSWQNETEDIALRIMERLDHVE